MKKYFLLTAMAGLALTSCVKNEFEVPQTGGNKVISFAAPVVSSNTRAVNEIGKVFDPSLQFTVWGHYYSDEYTKFEDGKDYIIKGVASYYDGDEHHNTWYPRDKSGNLYYWPKNGSMTFIAYSSKLDNFTVEVKNNGLNITNYSVDPNVTKQEDLLFSERAYNKSSSTDNSLSGVGSPYNGADIQFRHALSSIVFNAKLKEQYKGMTVKLKGITLNNVAGNGNFCQNLDDENNKVTNTLLNSRNESSTNLSATEAKWNVFNKVSYSVAGIISEEGNGYELDNGTQPVAYWPCTGGNEEPQELDNFRVTDLILIPQALVKDESTGDRVSLTIDYSIQSTGGEEINQTHKIYLEGTWEIGYRYIYNIEIGFNPITMAPTVEVWSTPVAIDIKP